MASIKLPFTLERPSTTEPSAYAGDVDLTTAIEGMDDVSTVQEALEYLKENGGGMTEEEITYIKDTADSAHAAAFQSQNTVDTINARLYDESICLDDGSLRVNEENLVFTNNSSDLLVSESFDLLPGETIYTSYRNVPTSLYSFDDYELGGTLTLLKTVTPARPSRPGMMPQMLRLEYTNESEEETLHLVVTDSGELTIRRTTDMFYRYRDLVEKAASLEIDGFLSGDSENPVQNWVIKDQLDKKIEDAPKDDKTYGRKNGAWAEVNNDAQVQADWNETSTTSKAYIKNKPSLFDGNYNSLTNKPTLFDGNYNSLTNKPTLFDGDYESLTNKPEITQGMTDEERAQLQENTDNIATNSSLIAALQESGLPTGGEYAFSFLEETAMNGLTEDNTVGMVLYFGLEEDASASPATYDSTSGKLTIPDGTYDSTTGKITLASATYDNTTGQLKFN